MPNRESMPYVPEEGGKEDNKGKPVGLMKKARSLLGVAALGVASLGSPAEAEPPQLPQTELSPLGDKELVNFFERAGIHFDESRSAIELPDGEIIYYRNLDDKGRPQKDKPQEKNIQFALAPDGQILTIRYAKGGMERQLHVRENGNFVQDDSSREDFFKRAGVTHDGNVLKLPNGEVIDFGKLDKRADKSPNVEYYEDSGGEAMRIIVFKNGQEQVYNISADGTVDSPETRMHATMQTNAEEEEKNSRWSK